MIDIHPPAWLYHEVEAARIFETDGDIQAALTDGWRDSPEAAKSANVVTIGRRRRLKNVNDGG